MIMVDENGGWRDDRTEREGSLRKWADETPSCAGAAEKLALA